MYINENERDQINYHRFLKNARNHCGVNQMEVSKGLYTASSYNRAEAGNRVPEKMIRDRLVSRMGFSGEKYIEYLGLEELQQWQFRQKVVKTIEEKHIANAETALVELDKITDKTDTVQVQFIKSMHFFLLKLKGASLEELFASVSSAIACTVENIDKALIGRHLLAEQELNLIAEYMRLYPFMGKVSNEHTWRILEYQKLVSYMNYSFMEKLSMVKIYPKVTYLICEALFKEEPDLYKLKEAEKICEKSLTLLKDTHRLYYFMEILEYRKEILKRILNNGSLEEAERDRMQLHLEETIHLETIWKAYYAEYGISPYMENDMYLYWETDCESSVEVMEARRKMFRIPRLTLSDGVCAERSLIRIERSNLTPSMFVLHNVFERLGLCAEYRRGTLVSTDIEVLDIYQKLVVAMNTFCREDCKIYLEELKEKLDMSISFNQQEIKRIEYIYANKTEGLSQEELAQRIIDTLECTLPVWTLYNHKGNSETYFTRSELACIYDLAFMVSNSHSERCREIVEEYCRKKEGYPINLGMIEFLWNGYISYLIKNNEKIKAERIRGNLIKQCLFYKRMPIVLLSKETEQVMWIE